jgi:hypothetical protein
MNQPLLDLIAFAAGAVVVLVDRRRAVVTACIVVALGLAPVAATYGGSGAAIVVLGAGAAAAVAGSLAGVISARMPARPGVDPLQPVGTANQGLFGPRSVRVMGALVALLAASWVSFNVPVGSVVPVQGVLFPVAFVFMCGLLRVVLARNLTDLAVGVAVIATAVSVGWLLRGGGGPLPDAAGVVAIAPAVAVIDGWLGFRHRGSAPVARS